MLALIEIPENELVLILLYPLMSVFCIRVLWTELVWSMSVHGSDLDVEQSHVI